MDRRWAWRTSALLAVLLATSGAATSRHQESVDPDDSGRPSACRDDGCLATKGGRDSSDEEGPRLRDATEASPQSDSNTGSLPDDSIASARLERGASFLRAHVANRMQRFSGHDSDEVAEAILAASLRAGIDPLLLLAIIEVESDFDPLARSSRNALGLMQVKPSTLWREAKRSGLVGDDPHDPKLNVAAGALYFRRLVGAFGPNDVALMAYNTGPNRILELIRAGVIPDHCLEYPRRVRAAEARLRRALAVESAGNAVARNGPAPSNVRVE